MGNVVNLNSRRDARLEDLAYVKACLLMNIQSSADFRAMKAEEYPDDKRNMRSSLELIELNGYVEWLPYDHALFKTVFRVIFSGIDLYRIIERESYELGGYGFHGKEDPEEFITQWISMYEEAEEWAASEGRF